MSAAKLTVIGRISAQIHLGEEIARGGEAAIRSIAEWPDRVAKIYLQPLSPERIDKLRAMVAFGDEQTPKDTAWPSGLLADGGKIVGLAMPRIAGRHDIHNLFSGAARRTLFPAADYRMLVATATNLARAVANVHAAGHVIGDINERCAMIGPDATVKLIDCDSFQVDAYSCDVGVPMYQPPELANVHSFRGMRRNRNHDAFGLAVLIFQLLFLGRHPFAGRPNRGEAPEIPDAIAKFQFAWGPDRGLQQPKHTFDLADVGLKIATYFDRAFGPDGASAGRPRAAAWAEALADLQSALRRCSVNAAHWHLPGPCALCRIEQATGVKFFLLRPGAATVRFPAWIESETLWAAIEAESLPFVRPRVPVPADFIRSVTPVLYYPDREPAWFGRIFAGLGWHEPAIMAERRRRAAVLADTHLAYTNAVATWHAADRLAAFGERKAELQAIRNELNSVFKAREDALAALKNVSDLPQFLATHGIAEARIKGFGAPTLAKLVAYGISTAADISAETLAVVPSIGPKRKLALVEWRDSVADAFQPNVRSGAALNADAIGRIDARYEPAILRMLGILRDGPKQLRAIAKREQKRGVTELAALARLAAAVAQAEVDVDVLNQPARAGF